MQPLTKDNIIKLTSEEQSSEAFENMLMFINDSPYTKKSYVFWLRKFMKFCGVTEPDKLLSYGDSLALERKIFSFIKDERDNKKTSPGSIHNYIAALKLFYSANKIEGISWLAVKKVKGARVIKIHDKPYEHEQIAKLLTKADERTRVMVLLMCSAGLRRGGLPGLKVGDLNSIKIHNLDSESSVYQIEVYNNSNDHYTTFCTPECASAIDFYLGYRRRCGETITEDSPLLREQFNRLDKDSITNPRFTTDRGIETLIYDLQYSSGVLTEKDRGNPGGANRHKMMSSHGLRKFFRTQCGRASMNTLSIETLMGHDTGLQKVYFKPSAEDLLKEYSKAIINLTINSVERERLRVYELEAKSEKQQEQFTKAFAEAKATINQMSKSMFELMEKVERLEKKSNKN
jgi:integrase